MTLGQMADAVATAMNAVHATHLTGKDVFDCDPQGELWPIWALYDAYVEHTGEWGDSGKRYAVRLLALEARRP